MNSLKRILLFTKRNYREILRDPTSLIFLFILPLVMLILFYAIFHTLTSQFSMPNLAPGMISFSHVFLSLFMSLHLAGDKESSFITRLYTTPFKSHEFIIGYALSVVPIGMMQTALILLVGGIMSPSFFSWNMLLCLPASIISILLFVGFGILFGTLFNQKTVGGISSILIMGQSLLSGMWFPLESLSQKFNQIIKCLPFRSGSLLFQNLCMGASNNIFTDVLHPLIVLSVYAIVAFFIAVIVYKKKMEEK